MDKNQKEALTITRVSRQLLHGLDGLEMALEY